MEGRGVLVMGDGDRVHGGVGDGVGPGVGSRVGFLDTQARVFGRVGVHRGGAKGGLGAGGAQLGTGRAVKGAICLANCDGVRGSWRVV